jgi:hypothetical protein
MMGEMATSERGATDVVKAVGAVIALLAGSVALLYIAGGAAMTLRLFLYGLPSLNVAAQLPREILISVALIQIVLPAVAVGSAYALVRLLLGRMASPPRKFVGAWNERSWRGWPTLLGASAVLALATTFVGASPAFARGTSFPWRLAVVVAIVFAISVVIMLVALRLRAEVAARANGGWNTLSSAGAMSVIVALAAVPACFVFAGTFRLLDAKVCTSTDSARSGRLIGELSDRIYLGETEADRWDDTDVPLRVVSIPKSEVEQMLIGSNPDTGGC